MKPEQRTRQEKIDIQLGRAGWSVGSRRLIQEYLVASSALKNAETPYRTKNEFADYALAGRLEQVLGIVEAKRSSRHPLEGERQAADYADAILAKTGTDPFIFLANGDEIWFWHRGMGPPRKVSGFFTEEDLLRLAHLAKFGKPLTGVMPLASIIDRAYQIEADKTIAEGIEAGQREFLPVLATGTGKTRVAVGLVELLQRQERIQRVLFLADRRELVKQALGTFKEHLPGAPRSWIEGCTIDKAAQILELYKSFNRLYPDLQRRGLAKVIDSQMERAEKTLDDFKNKDFPRVAISVDMLDTGIDVPSLRNLVFAKPVFSKVKFWQMLGRGTRTWTDPQSGEKKADFLVIDHWDNFDYFQVNKDGRAGSVSEPLPSRLFRLRLEKLQILAGRSEAADVARTIAQLRQLVGTLPLDNINVAPHADEIRTLAGSDAPWRDLSEERLTHLSHTIARLLRFSIVGSYIELQFENQTEQLALAHLRADSGEIESLRQRICENLALLPTNIPEIRQHLEALATAQTDAFWANLTCAHIMRLQETFAPLMRFRNRRPPATFVRLSLPDQIQQRHWIVFGPSGEGAFAETYRGRIEALVRDLAGDNPALQRLQRGEELDTDDLDGIAAALNGPDFFVTEEQLRKAYDQPKATLADFLRHILHVSSLPSRETTISAAFDRWVGQHPHLTATQLMFVRTVRKAVMQKAEAATLEALRQPPFNAIGDPEKIFEKSELAELFDLIQTLAA